MVEIYTIQHMSIWNSCSDSKITPKYTHFLFRKFTLLMSSYSVCVTHSGCVPTAWLTKKFLLQILFMFEIIQDVY